MSPDNLPAFRQELEQIDPHLRDEWLDQRLGLGELPGDGRDLPRGCVPYLPSSVDVVLRVIERAGVTSGDVFIDVGSGLGRAMMLVHLLTGAGAVGLEVQAGLVAQAREIAARLGLARVPTLHGDAADLLGYMNTGSVFFFYCPFGGERLARSMAAIEPLARARPLRLCFVAMPAPDLPWLARDTAPQGRFEPVTVCRTRLHFSAGARDRLLRGHPG